MVMTDVTAEMLLSQLYATSTRICQSGTPISNRESDGEADGLIDLGSWKWSVETAAEAASATAAATSPKNPIGHISWTTMEPSWPFNEAARAARTKCVNGSTRAQLSIPWNGNIKPDNSIEGR
jgi:hypothetical protein